MSGKSNVDLDGMSAEELTALIQAAEAKRAEKQEEAKAALIAEMTEKAAALGMTLDALTGRAGKGTSTNGRKPRSDAGKPVAAKYRGPNGETWSGRGRPPAWLAALEMGGRRRDEFLV